MTNIVREDCAEQRNFAASDLKFPTLHNFRWRMRS